MQFSYQARKEKERKVLMILLFFISIILLVNVIMSFVVFPVKQNSVSMVPDIPESSSIMVSPLSKNYKRGDVVLIKARKNVENSTLYTIGNQFVKFFTGQQFDFNVHKEFPGTSSSLRRIVGIPGDTFYMRDYVMYIKPAGEKHFLTEFEIADTNYDVTFFIAPDGWDSSLGVKGSFDEITLGENEYFLLADNRKASDDSRLWGIVTTKDIKAKALMCYFPFNKIKFF